MSVWVEIDIVFTAVYAANRSRSTWACELKYPALPVLLSFYQSRSTWACELKYFVFIPFNDIFRHAPRERVSWNFQIFRAQGTGERHAPRERVSWNPTTFAYMVQGLVTLHVSVWVEITLFHSFKCHQVVTLHVSVWVEIYCTAQTDGERSSRSTWACELKSIVQQLVCWWLMSRSTWACELKLQTWPPHMTVWHVTLHVSVWVEMTAFQVEKSSRLSRSTWACELKSPVAMATWPIPPVTLHVSVWVEIGTFSVSEDGTVSRSTWACELKLKRALKYTFYCRSHAPRERVSWNLESFSQFFLYFRHAPRERVSWNRHRYEWDFKGCKSRSTWACELKFIETVRNAFYGRHAPRERVSWNSYRANKS